MFEHISLPLDADGEPDYKLMLLQAKELVKGEKDLIANLANISALIMQSLPRLNWAGFYLWKEPDGLLVLGPFQGRPACVRIEAGKGVCGAAIAHRKTQKVDDVHAFPGHIPCDSASNSELVVPLFLDERPLGVIDLDSPEYGRFSDEDQAGIEELARFLSRELDWT